MNKTQMRFFKLSSFDLDILDQFHQHDTECAPRQPGVVHEEQLTFNLLAHSGGLAA